MRDEEQSKPLHRNVALLVVHGIGDQVEGYTRQKVIDGLVSVYGKDLVNFGPDEKDVVTLQLPMKGGRCRVRLYEVFWAGTLKESERGSFELRGIGAVAWYPLINLIERRYPSEHRKPLRVLLWTLFLVPLVALIWFGYSGSAGIINIFHRDRSDRRSWVDRQLDKSVGDVFTYVKSMRGEIAVNRSQFDAAERILACFRVARKAADDDPNVDEIQVLAHSLGTVIAFHGLTDQRAATVVNALNEGETPIVKSRKPVTALLTIGSPLMKIMFFWPELIAEHVATNSSTGAHRSMPPWRNFYNRLDPVSGRLRGLSSQIEISDEAIWAGGAVTSHTIYETNKSFLRHLTRSLTGEEAKPSVPWWKVALQVMWSPIETAGALIVVPFIMIIGAGYVFALLGLLAKFAGWATEKAGMTTVGMFLSDWGPLGIMCLLFVWLIWQNRLRAITLRGTSAQVAVLDEHIPIFLKAASEAVQEGFGETQIGLVTRTVLKNRQSEFTFPVKSDGKPGRLDLNVRRVDEISFFIFSGDKRVVESVRSALRTAWERLLKDHEASESGK